MGNVRLYGSTSGYTELAPPAVAPDGVVSLPSGTGTLVTTADVAALVGTGKILQVVRATDTVTRSTNSTSFVDVTGMSVTITPQKSTSAILIIANFFFSAVPSAGSKSVGEYQITDSSDTAISGAQLAQTGINANTGDSFNSNPTMIAYATPATTSAVTYKLRFRSPLATITTYCAGGNSTSQLYAIEVSA